MSSWRIGSCTSCRLENTDISATADYFKLDRATLMSDVQAVVAGFRKNETEMPAVSNTVMDLFDRGWHYATLFFGETQIRTGHLLVGALQSRELARALHGTSKEFSKISVETLSAEYRKIWAGSEEEHLRPMDGSGLVAAGSAGAQEPPPAPRARRRSIAFPRISPPRRNPAKWIRSSAATRKSGRSSTC